jgi:hypothetical protein
MPQRNADFLEVRLGQFRQDFEVDVVLAERVLVLAETEVSQPITDVHCRVFLWA